MRAVGLKDHNLPPRWIQCDEILMLNYNPAAVGEMNPKRPKRLGVERISDLIDFHSPYLIYGPIPDKAVLRRGEERL